MVSPALFRGYDRAGLDDQYDNPAGLPDRPDYLTRWQSGAEEARARFRPELDLAYGPGPRQQLDVFKPSAASGPRPPIFFYIHGGYWHRHDKTVAAHLALVFAKAGALFVAPGYSRVPEVPLARVIEDVRAALRFTFENAERLGGDPKRLHVGGFSAGAHLAAMLMATAWAPRGLPADVIRSVTAVSGVYDLEPLRHASLNETLQIAEADVLTLSPVHLQPRSGAPLLLGVGGGESEEFRRQTRDLAAAWSPYLPVTVLEAAGRHHLGAQAELEDAGSPLAAAALARLELAGPRVP
ncbi:MAG TPA: alpha/beta hydrolase [Vicinamibacteria bacterium]